MYQRTANKSYKTYMLYWGEGFEILNFNLDSKIKRPSVGR